MSGMLEEEEARQFASQEEEFRRHSEFLDALIATLAKFKSPQHLMSQIDLLFNLCDVDDSGMKFLKVALPFMTQNERATNPTLHLIFDSWWPCAIRRGRL